VEESCKRAERQLGTLATMWAAGASGWERVEEVVTEMCNSKTVFKQLYFRVEKGSSLVEWSG